MEARFNCKEAEFSLRPFEIIEVIELPLDKYAEFFQNPLADYDFIAKNTEESHVDENGIARCKLILCEGKDDGILVNTEGYNYARYTSFLPCARQIAALQKSPMLSAHVNTMDALVDHYAKQAVESQLNGESTINYYRVKDFSGRENFDEELFVNMMEERKEIESIDYRADGYEIVIADDFVHPEENLKVLDQQDVNIMCANHVLWQNEVGGAQADFTGCLLEDIDMSNKDLTGAIFDNAKLVNVNLKNSAHCFSTFNNTRFYNCDLERVVAEEAEFNGVRMYNCDLKNTLFGHCNFKDARLIGCKASDTDMSCCCIQGANFDDTEKWEINLKDASENYEEWQNVSSVQAVKMQE